MIQSHLKLPEPLILELSEDELSYIKTMATDIHSSPAKARGRSLELIMAHTTAGVILEFALERQGALKNPAEFDHTIPDSHNWDVEWDGMRCEVKNAQDPDKMPEGFEIKWLTMSNYMGNKLARNRKLYPECVDVVIFGCYSKIAENTYDVRWRCVAPFNTIRETLTPCNPDYDNNWTEEVDGSKKLKFFYDHRKENRCIYNHNL